MSEEAFERQANQKRAGELARAMERHDMIDTMNGLKEAFGIRIQKENERFNSLIERERASRRLHTLRRTRLNILNRILDLEIRGMIEAWRGEAFFKKHKAEAEDKRLLELHNVEHRLQNEVASFIRRVALRQLAMALHRRTMQLVKRELHRWYTRWYQDGHGFVPKPPPGSNPDRKKVLSQVYPIVYDPIEALKQVAAVLSAKPDRGNSLDPLVHAAIMVAAAKRCKLPGQSPANVNAVFMRDDARHL